MTQWIKSVEARMGSAGGGSGGNHNQDPDPVPKHLLMTKQVIDFIKYVGVLIVGIATLGWMGHEYVSQFQTGEQAEAAQSSIDTSISELGGHVEDNEEAINNLRVSGVRIELEQRQTNDRLSQLLELSQADNSRERAEARERMDAIQERIDRRDRVIRDPQALRHFANQSPENPLGGL